MPLPQYNYPYWRSGTFSGHPNVSFNRPILFHYSYWIPFLWFRFVHQPITLTYLLLSLFILYHYRLFDNELILSLFTFVSLLLVQSRYLFHDVLSTNVTSFFTPFSTSYLTTNELRKLISRNRKKLAKFDLPSVVEIPRGNLKSTAFPL